MKLTDTELQFLERAIALSQEGMMSGQGGPFGCVVVQHDKIIAEGNNRVLVENDPTAHAEVVAIRKACDLLGSWQLTDCDIYTSCEPCPMCLGAIYWARPKRVIYANSKEEAAAIEFDDDFIYKQINTATVERNIPFFHVPHPDAKKVFEFWKSWEDKVKY
ncbi:MAG TPA: nucleoside deaminase [Chitinophagaceae bacterium]|nr:nucleoside deaminase [Chitinophagaceae bacterium]